LWQAYADQGVVVWGIGSQDSMEALTVFKEQMGVTFPILYDEGEEAHAGYNPGSVPTNSIYPQDWIIGVDGTVVYMNTQYEPDEMKAVIEAELAKMTRAP
jgi:peroxiredoxin